MGPCHVHPVGVGIGLAGGGVNRALRLVEGVAGVCGATDPGFGRGNGRPGVRGSVPLHNVYGVAGVGSAGVLPPGKGEYVSVPVRVPRYARVARLEREGRSPVGGRQRVGAAAVPGGALVAPGRAAVRGPVQFLPSVGVEGHARRAERAGARGIVQKAVVDRADDVLRVVGVDRDEGLGFLPEHGLAGRDVEVDGGEQRLAGPWGLHRDGRLALEARGLSVGRQPVEVGPHVMSHDDQQRWFAVFLVLHPPVIPDFRGVFHRIRVDLQRRENPLRVHGDGEACRQLLQFRLGLGHRRQRRRGGAACLRRRDKVACRQQHGEARDKKENQLRGRRRTSPPDVFTEVAHVLPLTRYADRRPSQRRGGRQCDSRTTSSPDADIDRSSVLRPCRALQPPGASVRTTNTDPPIGLNVYTLTVAGGQWANPPIAALRTRRERSIFVN